MQVKLRVMLGKSSGKEIDIPVPRFLIGRADDCHLRPKSDSISRNHCAILTGETHVTVRDLNSKNGTFVNGERVSGECPLHDGDELRVGKLEFQVVILAPEGASLEPAAPAAQPVAATVELASPPVKEKEEPAPAAAAQAAPAPASGNPNDSVSTEFDVSAWLVEADAVEQARRRSDPETRQFKLEETDRVKLQEAQQEVEEGTDAKAAGKEKPKMPEKKPVGKLPQRPGTAAANSREAAAEMLKKYFRR